MARENRDLGYDRIAGALANLGRRAVLTAVCADLLTEVSR